MSKLYLLALVIILSPLSIFNVQGADGEVTAAEPSKSKVHNIRVSVYYTDPDVKDLLGDDKRIVILVGQERVGTLSKDQMIPKRNSVNEAVDVSTFSNSDSVSISWFIERSIEGGYLVSRDKVTGLVPLQCNGDTLKAVRLHLSIISGNIEGKILFKHKDSES